MKRFFSFFDARDLFVFAGFALLFEGLREHYGLDVAMMVTGAIILFKGLKPWA